MAEIFQCHSIIIPYSYSYINLRHYSLSPRKSDKPNMYFPRNSFSCQWMHPLFPKHFSSYLSTNLFLNSGHSMC